MKLEDLPKKQVFNVPDGYFEALPQRIQKRIAARVDEGTPSFFLRYKLQYILPAVVLAVLVVTLFVPRQSTADVESLLASVETEDLINYLDQSELTIEDLIQDGDFSNADAEQIETEVYDLQLETESIDAILEDIENENI